MKIKRLKLHNFRCFKQQSLEFSQGLIGILGPNGSGKSTILEAIAWVLYGSAGSRTDKQSIRYDQAGETAECRVTMTLEIEGAEYQIQRSFRGSSLTPHGWVKVDGVKVVESVSGVSQYVEDKLLKMKGNAFFKSVFSKQKEVDALSNIRSEERRELFSQMLGIDPIKEARLEAGRDAARKFQIANSKQEELLDLEQLGQQLIEITQQAKAQKLQVETKANILQAIEGRLEKARASHQQLVKTRDRFKDLKADLNGQQSRAAEIQHQLTADREKLLELQEKRQTVKELEPAEQRYQELLERKNSLEKLKTAYYQRQAKFDQLVERQEEIELKKQDRDELLEYLKDFTDHNEQLQAQRESLQQLQDERGELREAISRIDQQLDSLADQIALLREDRREVEQIGDDGECPVCTQKLGDDYPAVIQHFDQEIAEKEEEIEQLTSAREDLQEELDELDENLQRANSRLEELRETDRQFQNFKSRRDQLQKDISRLTELVERRRQEIEQIGEVDFDEQQYQKTSTELEQLEETHQTYQRLTVEIEAIDDLKKTIDKRQQDLAEISDKIELLEQKLAELQFDPEAYERATKQLDRVREEKDRVAEETSELKQQYVALQTRVEQTEKRLQEEQEKKARIEQLRREARHLERVKQHLQEFRHYLLHRIRPALAGRTSRLLEHTTGGLYSEVLIAENFEVRVKTSGNWQTLGRFSGGETDLVNLCLRIAISEMIARQAGREIKFIVLDEVFGSQDEQRRLKILQALKRLDDLFDQIFLITHAEDVKDRLENVFLTSRPSLDSAAGMSCLSL